MAASRWHDSLVTPRGTECFDEIVVVENVGLENRKTGDGFKAVVPIPPNLIGLTFTKGAQIKMDLG